MKCGVAIDFLPFNFSYLQSLGNDNVVDENNLSEGELESDEAVTSVNQYIMQPRYGGNAGGGHHDRHLSVIKIHFNSYAHTQ